MTDDLTALQAEAEAYIRKSESGMPHDTWALAIIRKFIERAHAQERFADQMERLNIINRERAERAEARVETLTRQLHEARAQVQGYGHSEF